MAPRRPRPRIEGNSAGANEPWSSLLAEQSSAAERKQHPLLKPPRERSRNHANITNASERTREVRIAAVGRGADVIASDSRCSASSSAKREDVAEAAGATEKLRQENELLRAQLQAAMTRHTLGASDSVPSEVTEDKPPPKTSLFPVPMSIPLTPGIAGVPLLGSQVPVTHPLQGENSQQTQFVQSSSLPPSQQPQFSELSQRASLLPVVQQVPVLLLPQHFQLPQQYLQQFELPQPSGCSGKKQSVPSTVEKTLTETFQELREEQHRQQQQLELLQKRFQGSSSTGSCSEPEIETANHSASLSSAVGDTPAASASSLKAGNKSADGSWRAAPRGAGIPMLHFNRLIAYLLDLERCCVILDTLLLLLYHALESSGLIFFFSCCNMPGLLCNFRSFTNGIDTGRYPFRGHQL